MKTIVLSVLATLLFSFTIIHSEIWEADKSHSSINFIATRFGVSEIYGSFNKMSAQFTLSKEDFSDAVFEFSAEANSITTNEEKRDVHLKSADFFDVQKFSVITFTSTHVKKIDAKNYTIMGNLTMHGVTKSIELQAVIRKGTNTRMKQDFIVVGVNGTIHRSDFAIGSSIPNAVISDEVLISGNASFVKR